MPPSEAAAPAPPTTTAVPNPERDAKALAAQGAERPTPGQIGAQRSDVYAEDWWSAARPVFELHGYYRVRSELFHHFALGRRDLPNSTDVHAPQQLWPQPADNDYTPSQGANKSPIILCGSDPLNLQSCDNNTQAGANMRFRLNPELHISDNLRVMSQIDMLDNVVLGSTPEGYANTPAPGPGGGYTVAARGGYAPLGAFSSTQWAPASSQNSTADSIAVKRVWGEYLTPVGMLRFGRMPNHWGLGMMYNAGDGYDSDWQSTVDRIMFITGIKKYDIYFAGAWDFPNEGAISTRLNEQQGQPYDLGQLDDVNEYALVAVRRRNPDLQKLELARGDVVMNGGVYFVFRNQVLANDGTTPGNSAALGASSSQVATGYTRRGMKEYVPDLWLQFLYKKFRFELEAVMIYGSLENTEAGAGQGKTYKNPAGGDNGWNIREFGMATQTEFRALEDKLKLQFGFGYASGDGDLASLAPGPESTGMPKQLTADRTYSEFAFHPDYRVDLIFFRNILSRVEGAYYFRPSVDYDFTRDKNGQRIGGGAALIWSRASEFIQTPGHAHDLGIELNFQLYYQSKDGALNDDPDKMGGFYTALQYGVFFPLGGLDYLPGQQNTYKANNPGSELDTATAQTVRWYIGILF